MMIHETKEIICIVCFSKFLRSINGGSGKGLPSEIRPKNTITCSRECARFRKENLDKITR